MISGIRRRRIAAVASLVTFAVGVGAATKADARHAVARSVASPKTVGPLTGPFLLNTGDSYEISFAGLPEGTYRYYCAPHLALGMRAVIEVK